MTAPVQLQLLDVIGARLALPSTARGYAHTVKTVERARLTPLASHDLPSVNYWIDDDALIERGAGWHERDLTVLIDARAATRDRPFVDVALELGNDLWIALHRDPLAPATTDPVSARLGGMAEALALEVATPAVGQGQAPFCGIALRLSVRYRVRPSQPFTLIT